MLIDRCPRPLQGTLVGLSLAASLFGVVFTLQPFGHRGWTFAAAFAALAWLAWGLRQPVPPEAARSVGRLTRRVLVAGLSVWLGLIAWSALSPGGPMPPPKANPDALRVLTWNVLLGSETGLPWNRHDWLVRKPALLTALRAIAPDILCVQEALDGQVKFLESELPGHRREGVGRDDGRSGGEHCAIFFDAGRFERLDGGTFWLEEPSDRPPEGSTSGPKRICSWVRLRDRPSGRVLRVYNAHLYLTESARLRAVRIILDRVGSGHAGDDLLLAGDFNATPDAPSRALLATGGLDPVAVDTPTYQFYGIRWRSLDEIYASPGWRPAGRWVVDAKPGNSFPSDHFGVLADLVPRR